MLVTLDGLLLGAWATTLLSFVVVMVTGQRSLASEARRVARLQEILSIALDKIDSLQRTTINLELRVSSQEARR